MPLQKCTQQLTWLHGWLAKQNTHSDMTFCSNMLWFSVHIINSITSTVNAITASTKILNLVHRSVVASPSIRTTNRPWKGCGCVTWPIFTMRRYAKRGICRYHVSVCMCVSVRLRYCIKMAKRRITQIMHAIAQGHMMIVLPLLVRWV